jgi:hypothetical protein
MTTKKAWILSILMLVLTVPWFITSSEMIFGFPAWAFYALIVTVLYSFLIAYLFQIYHTQNRNKHP